MVNQPSDILFVLYMAATFAFVVLLITGLIYLLRRAGHRRRQRAREAALEHRENAAGPRPYQRSNPRRGSASDLDGYL